MNILLQDDEALLLEQLGQYLKMLGHHVTLASNGQDGWNVYSAQPNAFDVIISDIKMPRLSGLDFLQKLRRENFKTPIIFMTGHADLNAAVTAIKLGAFDFILKPFKLNFLRESLEKLQIYKIPVNDLKEIMKQPEIDIQLTIDSNTRLISAVSQYFQNMIEPLCRVYDISIYQINLCLVESLSNAIIHGNLMVPSTHRESSYEIYVDEIKKREQAPEYLSRQVILGCRVRDHVLTLKIQDHGNGFNWSKLPLYDPLSLAVHGRGILIMKTTMDAIEWNETGNCVTMTKNLKPAEQSP
ncbi:MAG: response regulator [SAR324 cluster bacterium]|nr:response regulator [SAR324 cluster bacterium]